MEWQRERERVRTKKENGAQIRRRQFIFRTFFEFRFFPFIFLSSFFPFIIFLYSFFHSLRVCNCFSPSLPITTTFPTLQFFFQFKLHSRLFSPFLSPTLVRQVCIQTSCCLTSNMFPLCSTCLRSQIHFLTISFPKNCFNPQRNSIAFKLLVTQNESSLKF